MKILIMTEKCGPDETQRDGGARVVNTLKNIFGNSMSIMQFGSEADSSATWHFKYPFNLSDRFMRRLANASFIREKLGSVEKDFSHVIFIHLSMQFGVVDAPLGKEICVWTFPMFLTPSYKASGEIVPEAYFEMERLTLNQSQNILTPSRLERQQLIKIYSVPEERIHVVPRGVDSRFLRPKIRTLKVPLIFCSIGSIKPQKNITGLIRLFVKIRNRYNGAVLKIIGPVQDVNYYKTVCHEIEKLSLNNAIEFLGYVSPNKLAEVISDAHFHLSASNCETFGRSIFETLALGLPNIARATGNAAAEFLNGLPYVRFVDDEDKAITYLDNMLVDFSSLSSMALEVGDLYDDAMLSSLLAAKVCKNNIIAISDFDGTLFHKNDPDKTTKCVKKFQGFPVRVLCSARPIQDLIDIIKSYNLTVDWVIGYSGAAVANSCGELLWKIPLQEDKVIELKRLIPEAVCIEIEGKVIQVAIPLERLSCIKALSFRVEVYQETAFIFDWSASKLRAALKLLRYISWPGQVRVFGDGLYDIELLTYFDGVSTPHFSINNNYLKGAENVNRVL